MDVFGMTRSQARALSRGLDSFNDKLDRRQKPDDNAGRKEPPKIEVSETTSKTSRPGSMGNPNLRTGGSGGGGGSTVSALVMVITGTSLSAETITLVRR